jgi:hypothetical protein
MVSNLPDLMQYHNVSSDGISPCTPEEIAEIQEAQKRRELLAAEEARTEYQRLRAAEYPSINEYIDGVVKGDQAQIDKYIADCLAIKAKYPKPST